MRIIFSNNTLFGSRVAVLLTTSNRVIPRIVFVAYCRATSILFYHPLSELPTSYTILAIGLDIFVIGFCNY